MTTTYADIVKKIKEAVSKASGTASHPEAELRELAAQIRNVCIRARRLQG